MPSIYALSGQCLRLRCARLAHNSIQFTKSPLILSSTPLHITASSCLLQRATGTPNVTYPTEHLTPLLIDQNNPEDWSPIYRWKGIVYLQRFNHILHVFCATTLCYCVALCYGSFVGDLEPSAAYTAATFGLLCAASNVAANRFYMRFVGLISLHKSSGLIRIAHLTFFGKRKNVIIDADQVVVPGDLSPTSTNSSVVEFAILKYDEHATLGDIDRRFKLSRLWKEILDKESFHKIFNLPWE